MVDDCLDELAVADECSRREQNACGELDTEVRDCQSAKWGECEALREEMIDHQCDPNNPNPANEECYEMYVELFTCEEEKETQCIDLEEELFRCRNNNRCTADFGPVQACMDTCLSGDASDEQASLAFFSCRDGTCDAEKYCSEPCDPLSERCD
jgi:hypothetical protein